MYENTKQEFYNKFRTELNNIYQYKYDKQYYKAKVGCLTVHAIYYDNGTVGVTVKIYNTVKYMQRFDDLDSVRFDHINKAIEYNIKEFDVMVDGGDDVTKRALKNAGVYYG